MNIFDLVTSEELASYWTILTADEAPYFGETLFDTNKKLGLDLSWIKGRSGMPVVLRSSAFDVAAIPRPRIGMERLSAEMPFFKESKTIDEVTRQQLNMLLDSNKQLMIDTILNNIFNDMMDLLRGAAAQRERMRMMALTTGMVVLAANGQEHEFDYLIPDENKRTVPKAWNDPAADIIGDIYKAQELIVRTQGAKVTRAVCNQTILGYMRNNEAIRLAIKTATEGKGFISTPELMAYIFQELELEIAVVDAQYKDENNISQKYVPDGTFVMFPNEKLGTLWFGTTPEESDLMTSQAANVTIVDVGVAVTTTEVPDPVGVSTKVSMICLPSLEAADKIVILDTLTA